MKKFLAVFFSALMLIAGTALFAACGGNGEPSAKMQIDVYAPDGAPALALAQLMNEEKQFGEKVNYKVVDAATIQTYVTGNEPAAEIAVLPVNLAAKLLGTGERYKMLGAVTHGNLYILSANGAQITEENAAEMFAGSKIGCLQLNNFVGYVLRTVLAEYDVQYEIRQDKQEENATEKAYLYSVDGSEINPAASFDYMVAAEPAVTKKVNATKDNPKSLQMVGNLQELYGEEGYPQAVLVAKTELIEEKPQVIEDFIEAVDASADWILDSETSAQTLYDAVVGHFEKEGTKPTFDVSDLTKEVLGRCAVRFESAQNCKTRVLSFLEEISAAAEQSFTASDAFFYSPAAK